MPERDRGMVLSHLGDCASCREIVGLAQASETETGAVVLTWTDDDGSTIVGEETITVT